MSSSNCCFLTCIQISQEAGQVVWYSHLFQNFPEFLVIHTVKGFGIVNKAEIDVFMELSCFFNDPMDVGNLISCSSDFRKPAWTSGFRKGRGNRDQIANIRGIMEKAREFQKNIYFCFIDYAKSFDSVDHNKLWKILKEMGIPDYLICLLRNLYAGQEATVRTGHGTTDWFQIGKGVCQGCILSPCFFNLFAEYIHHVKHWAGRSTSWNQDCQEKCQ